MIKIISKCYQIEEFLNSETYVTDFRIVLRGNENLYVYIIFNGSNDNDQITDLQTKIKEIYTESIIEILDKEDLEDSFYKELFNFQNKVILSYGKRRLNWNEDGKKINHKADIITFYSYKGGMGRSTTLAAFALYLSKHYKKKVFIIDCDIEAPGFTNFFLNYPNENNQRNGLIEYIFDKKNKLINNELLSYTREIDKTYVGDGEIRIMHAGNLNSGKDENDKEIIDLTHYIHGLSRLDLGNPEYSSIIIEEIIDDIENTFHPDIILIDSRTGINDVFGLAVSRLSDHIVGLFRNDAQTLPGLYYFINEIRKNNLLTNVSIVNAILPSRKSEKDLAFLNFTNIIDDIINLYGVEDFKINCFPIQRNETLEMVGTPAEDLKDFISLINDKDFKDYNNLFESIIKKISYDKGLLIKNSTEQQYKNFSIDKIHYQLNPTITLEEVFNEFDADYLNRKTLEEKTQYLDNIRLTILNLTYTNLNNVDLYAEGISDILSDFNNNKFFLRECMKDLFNLNKFLILGSKGTGKTYIYRALKEKPIVNALRKYANKNDEYFFLEAINRNNKIITVDKLNSNLNNEETRYRFWIVYTWQVLSKWILENTISIDFSTKINNLGIIKNDLLLYNFGDNTTTLSWIESKIQDSKYVEEIESQYQNLDNFIKEYFPNTKLTILYDQLDDMVDPDIWDKWIPALIRIWRNQRFNHIFGKLFLRRDLFNKLIGLTNKNDIRNQAIDIEWKKEEIYSYLIQSIFYPNKFEALWKIMYLYDPDMLVYIKQYKKHFTSKPNLPILDDYLLRFQIETLFGKFVRTQQQDFNQESYDWFFNNLKNADDTISLRPFISLLKEALINWKAGKYKEEEESYPILYAQYYSEPEVRKKAVSQYFKDLIENQKGNQPIKYVFEYIEDGPTKYKKISLRAFLFNELLEKVIEKYKDKESMKEMTIEKLIILMESNGIISKINFGKGLFFRFSFLYKYTLGLKGS